MRIVLRQSFPLGRFHATPWRVNPFDDPFGEWPPSPWRLIRAVCARWYQWQREVGERPEGELDALIRALASSTYQFKLPEAARRGYVLRQYQPAGFGWNPAEKKKAATRGYGTTLVQDNAWCVPNDKGDEAAVWWFLEGEEWTSELQDAFDRCLERVVYFGRAESFTEIICQEPPLDSEPNCRLEEHPSSSNAVPVLTAIPDATRDDIERITDDPQAKGRTLPPGTVWRYAKLPERPPSQAVVRQSKSKHIQLIQFAVGWAVAPKLRSMVRLTKNFRTKAVSTLRNLGKDTSELSGKGDDGKPLTGHRHAAFLFWPGQCAEEARISNTQVLGTRILVWRQRPFSSEEQRAIFQAAEYPLTWSAIGKDDSDEWSVRLIPLDQSAAWPPGFQEQEKFQRWKSVTPFIPPHFNLRKGKPKPNESLEMQVRWELKFRGIPGADKAIVEEIEDPEWVSVYIPPKLRKDRKFLGERRGYRLRITLPEPVNGPLMLGHSCHLGLGLFEPVD